MHRWQVVVVVAVVAGGLAAFRLAHRGARRRTLALRRLSEVADRIGAREGELIADSGHGGGFVPYTLAVVTVRAGSVQEVADAQLRRALEAGFRPPPDPALLPCGHQQGGCLFHPSARLPMLSIRTYRAGERFPARDVVVPRGHTGVVITLS
jgi:hypothetical protein